MEKTEVPVLNDALQYAYHAKCTSFFFYSYLNDTKKTKKKTLFFYLIICLLKDVIKVNLPLTARV